MSLGVRDTGSGLKGALSDMHTECTFHSGVDADGLQANGGSLLLCAATNIAFALPVYQGTGAAEFMLLTPAEQAAHCLFRSNQALLHAVVVVVLKPR